MAVDKSTYNRKIKVSQGTVDDIKRLGMTKALRLAKMNAKGPQEGLVAEYQEATRRLYGDRRFAAATGTAPKKAAGTKVYNPKYASKPAPANPKQADKAASTKASTKYSPTKMKAPVKKNNNTSNIIKGVAGTAAAAGLLLATRGRGAGLATKLAPGLMKNKVAQALLTGEIKKAAPKVVSKASTKASSAVTKAKDAAAVARGKAAAKAGKPVSQSQYDAMVAAAKARGISTTAKKATTTAAKKTAAPKKAGLSAGKRWDANAPKVKPPKK
jgi:hypothetical protein